MTDASSQAAPPGEVQAFERRWAAMAVLLMASFMNMIDVNIVNVALPSMQRNLGVSDSGIEWVVAGYILAFALGLLPFGRYGDIVGKKRIFLIGVSAFTVASALCGLAANVEMLIAARVIQGIAGAVMTPQVLAIAQIMFPPKERAAAFSLFGLTAGLASVAGPITGGTLIHADLFGLDWRMGVFFLLVWIATAALSRYSSLSALVASVVIPLALWFIADPKVAAVATIMTLIIWAKHRANIERLLSGTEGRIGKKG